MEQDYIKFNDVMIPQPDSDGYTVQIATTSTEDSDRTQDLVMHNTPIGSVQSYGLKWSYLNKAEVALILGQVLNRSSFKVHYFDVVSATWKDADFYASNFNITPIDLTTSSEVIDELSFNIVGVNPV